MKRNRSKPRFAVITLICLLLTGLAGLVLSPVDWRLLWEGAREVFASTEALRDFVLGFGAWAPLAFFLTQVAQVVLAPVPGGAAVVVGTLLFGVWGGLALSIAGAVAGSAVLFVLVRRWGKPLAIKIVGEESFGRYADVLDEKGWWLFVILLVPFMPDDVVCALAGLSKVSLRRFVVLVAVGRTPSWALTALITADLATRSAAAGITAGLVVVGVLAVAFVYRQRLEAALLRLAGKGQGR